MAKGINVKKIQEKMQSNNNLKLFFYKFLSLNNGQYKVMSEEDSRLFLNEANRMNQRTNLLYAFFAGAFATSYFKKYGFRRTRSVLNHYTKLGGIIFILPLIPTGLLKNYASSEFEKNMLNIADKYPIEDETLYRDFVAHALPRFRLHSPRNVSDN